MMSTIALRFLFIVAVFFFPLSAEIHEISSLEEAKNFLGKNTLFFCELDEVFIYSEIMASKGAFFNALKEDLIQEGYQSEQVINKIYPIFSDVVSKSPYKITSPQVHAFLDVLHKKHISCIPITHRGPRLAYKTLDQLHHLDLQFPLDRALAHNLILEPELSHYYEGLLYVHPISSKSTYLLEFLEKLKIENKHIVCLDSQLLELIEMEEVFSEKGIPFIGLYFKSKDEVLTQKQVEIGKMQVKYLNQILPDHLGKLLLQKKINEHAVQENP